MWLAPQQPYPAQREFVVSRAIRPATWPASVTSAGERQQRSDGKRSDGVIFIIKNLDVQGHRIGQGRGCDLTLTETAPNSPIARELQRMTP